jgi:hypothetical protein
MRMASYWYKKAAQSGNLDATLLATKAPSPKTEEEMDELRDEMEDLALKFGGERL